MCECSSGNVNLLVYTNTFTQPGGGTMDGRDWSLAMTNSRQRISNPPKPAVT